MTTGSTVDSAFEGQALPPCCRYLVVIFHTQHVEVRIGELERDQVARWAPGVLADGQSEVLCSGPKPISVALPSQEVFERTHRRTPCYSNSQGHTCLLAEPDSKSKDWKHLPGLKQRGWTYCEGRCQATDVEQGDVALTALDAAEIAAGQPALKCQPFL